MSANDFFQINQYESYHYQPAGTLVCLLVLQYLGTRYGMNREGCYSLAHFFLRKRIRSVDDQGGYRFKCHLEHLKRRSHTSNITY